MRKIFLKTLHDRFCIKFNNGVYPNEFPNSFFSVYESLLKNSGTIYISNYIYVYVH